MMTLYDQAVALWGQRSQVDMMIEECSELITALRHFDRGRVTIEAVCSELADVEIMSAQMRVVFGSKLIDRKKDFKLLRLHQLIGRKGL